MKKVLLFSTILVILEVFPALAAEIISGSVKDSLSGLYLASVKVKITSPVCSTYTDSNGRFSMTLPSTSVSIPSDRLRQRIVRFDAEAFKRGEFKVFSVNGRAMFDFGRKAVPGLRIFIVHSGETNASFKMVDGFSSIPSMSVQSPNETEDRFLAKAAAYPYTVSFEKQGYDPLTRALPSGQNTEVKLVKSSSTAEIDVQLDTLGTAIITVEYQK